MRTSIVTLALLFGDLGLALLSTSVSRFEGSYACTKTYYCNVRDLKCAIKVIVIPIEVQLLVGAQADLARGAVNHERVVTGQGCFLSGTVLEARTDRVSSFPSAPMSEATILSPTSLPEAMVFLNLERSVRLVAFLVGVPVHELWSLVHVVCRSHWVGSTMLTESIDSSIPSVKGSSLP